MRNVIDSVKPLRHTYYSVVEWKLYRDHGCKPGIICFFK